MYTQAIGASLTPNFTSNRRSRENIDTFINADDLEIRRQALAFANDITEDKKHKKISNVMFYSVPAAAGVASALLTKGKTTFLSKSVSGIAAKTANGIKSAGYWALLLGAVDLVGRGKRELSKDSQTVRNFDIQHPFLSFAATVAAAGLTMAAGVKGLNYIASKLKPSAVFSIRTKVGKVANKINSNSVLRSIDKTLGEWKGKLPSPIRTVGKGLVAWAPDILLVGGIFHSINHEAKRGYVFSNAYNTVKDRQLELSKARMNEMKSDFSSEEA